MAKKKTTKKSKVASKRSQYLVLAVIAVVSVAILAGLAAWLGNDNNAKTPGVGADGFRVTEEKGANLGVANVANKEIVASALGNLVKNVTDAETSGVLNMNGNLGQTATYNFELPDGSKAWIDIDVTQYKTEDTLKAANVFQGTGHAATINGRDVRYAPASTLGKERLYPLLVVQDNKFYRFVFTQPAAKVQIKEYKAQDILKAIIAKSNL